MAKFDFRLIEQQIKFINGRILAAITQSDIDYCKELAEIFREVNCDYLKYLGNDKIYQDFINAICKKQNII